MSGRSDDRQAHLYGGHGAGDVEVLPLLAPGLHQRDAVAAAHGLGRVLPRGDVDRRDDVGRVGVKPQQEKYFNISCEDQKGRFHSP